MVTLTIDHRPISVPSQSTILEAARQLAIPIPTLCYRDGYELFTSCLLCLVQEMKTDQLLPACSTRVRHGMVIETNNEKVREYRKEALELLLSDHIGDCLAPCMRTCPAHMNIPLMIRQIKSGNFQQALITVKKDIALPAVLGRICPAPCEKGCYRSTGDGAVSICLLKRFVAEVDLFSEAPYLPPLLPATGKKVAIIGAGAAGLAAAYYLAQFGHACTIFDKNESPGGMLFYAVLKEKLPKQVLLREIDLIQKLGVGFRLNTEIGRAVSLKRISQKFDVVVLATGKLESKLIAESGVEATTRGVKVNAHSFQTNQPKIFAGGNVVSEGRMAIRSVAQGKSIAIAVNQFLTGEKVTGAKQRFDSRMGRLQNGEMAEFLKEALPIPPQIPVNSSLGGFTGAEAIREARRCLHCDCRKQDFCQLRIYADEYQANQHRFKDKGRKKFERIIQHADVIFEPGKCITCGLCVRITQSAGEKFGFTFIGRGFDVRLGVPLNESLTNGLQKVAAECVEACPTAALSFISPPD